MTYYVLFLHVYTALFDQSSLAFFLRIYIHLNSRFFLIKQFQGSASIQQRVAALCRTSRATDAVELNHGVLSFKTTLAQVQANIYAAFD